VRVRGHEVRLRAAGLVCNSAGTFLTRLSRYIDSTVLPLLRLKATSGRLPYNCDFVVGQESDTIGLRP
jgi:hypothetical protein